MSEGTPPPASAQLLRKVPFLDHLGVKVVEMEPGRSVLSLDPKPEHYNSWGGVHGGVIMTLLDVCMAVAGRAHDPQRYGGVTVDMSSSFIAPGKGKQIAKGRVVAQSATLWRCEGEIYNDHDGKLVARAIGTFKMLDFTKVRPVKDTKEEQ
jgi:uncharacterized protein (TIGR00369 family)